MSRFNFHCALIAPFFLSDLSCLDMSDVDVLILIQSSPSLRDRRDADRRTWMHYEKRYTWIKTLFVFGTPDVGGGEKEVSVEAEAEQFCDIVQMDYVDSYENVTLDTVSYIFVLSILP